MQHTSPFLLLALAAAPFVDDPQDAPTRIERLLGAMGTSLTIEVEAPTRALALSASETALRAIEEVEARLSTWDTASELSQLNASPVGTAFDASPLLRAELEQARHWWEATDGALDPSVGGLVAAWGLRTGGRAPTSEEIDAARVPGGFGALEFGEQGLTRTNAQLVIEEGGFGKGAGLAEAARRLAELDGVSGTLNLGGQVLYFGGGRARFAVADPREREREVLAMAVPAGSLSTSGNSERGIEVDGIAYGHLLDARTGRPVADFGSVTVWSEDPLAADCLSTAAYVMGPDAALAFAEERADVELLVLQVEGEHLRARATSGLRDRLVILTEDVILEFSLASAVAVAAGSRQDGQDPDMAATLLALEARDAELERRIDLVAGEVERIDLAGLIPVVGESEYGMGPAASKVYSVDEGSVSIGGYGEMLYENFSSDADDGSSSGKTDQADFLRAVLYFGYKFDEHWVFNSEIEFEHASTGASGSASVEFAYLDYLSSDATNFRAGLLLQPMGLTNEMHEPTTFLTAKRPGVETVIIPSTWRENGVGMFGDVGEFAYKAYVTGGLDASGFGDGGLRGGRQKGSKSKAEDLAFVGRVDWVGHPGLVLGASGYVGDSGQGLGGGADVQTTILEVHADWRWRGVRLRALVAHAELDDVTELNNALGLVGMASVGEELDGHFVEVGYDVMQLIQPGSVKSLTPFLRYEAFDTQASVPTGFASDPANDIEIMTYGVAYQPHPQVIFKLDFMDIDNDAGTGVDQINVSMGYVF